MWAGYLKLRLFARLLLIFLKGSTHLFLQFRPIVHGSHDCLREISLQVFDDINDASVRENMGGDQIVQGVDYT